MFSEYSLDPRSHARLRLAAKPLKTTFKVVLLSIITKLCKTTFKVVLLSIITKLCKTTFKVVLLSIITKLCKTTFKVVLLFLFAHVVAQQHVLVANVHHAIDYDQVGPTVQRAAIRLIEMPFEFKTVGRGFDQADWSVFVAAI